MLSLVLLFQLAVPQCQSPSPGPLPRGNRDQLDAAGRIVRDAAGAEFSYGDAPLVLADEGLAATGAESVAGPVHVGGYCAFGEGIGLSGIAIAQQGPLIDVVVGGGSGFGGNQWWQVLRWDGSGLETRLFGPQYPAGIQKLAVGDVRADAGSELVILSGGALEVRSLIDGLVLASFSGLADASALLLEDIGGDGLQEILLASPGSVRAVSGGGTLLFTHAGLGGSDLVVGQMDGDAALELATNDGRILDLGALTVQCTWANGFGAELEADDIDGDGLDELVYADAWSSIWTFDADACAPKGSFSNPNTDAMRLLDVEGDGDREIVVGDAQWGSVHVHDPLTFALLGQIGNPEHGTTDLAVADVDADGSPEILWGAGATSSGPDRLYVGCLPGAAIEWQNVQLDGPFVGPEQGDVDGDGQLELAFVSRSSNAGYAAGRIVLLDGLTLEVEGISQPVAQGLGWTGVHDLRLANADADVALEIVLATGTTYDGLIEIWSFAGGTFELQSSNQVLPFGATFYAADVLDLEGDGDLESIGVTGVEHTGASGATVIAYDAASGAQEWESPPIGLGFVTGRGLLVEDLDGDGAVEIVAFVRDGPAYLWDGVSKQPEALIDGSFYSVGSLDSGAASTLIFGDAFGKAVGYRCSNGVWRKVGIFDLGAGPIEGFSFGPRNTLCTSRGATYELRQLWHSTAPFWSTSSFGSDCGRRTVFQEARARFLITSQYACLAFDWQ